MIGMKKEGQRGWIGGEMWGEGSDVVGQIKVKKGNILQNEEEILFWGEDSELVKITFFSKV